MSSRAAGALIGLGALGAGAMNSFYNGKNIGVGNMLLRFLKDTSKSITNSSGSNRYEK